MPRNRDEERMQIALRTEIDRVLRPGVFWTALRGNPRNAARGAAEKAMGCKAGLPDLMFIERRGNKHHSYAVVRFIELKTRTGKVSKDQVAAHEELRNLGAMVAVCRSRDEVLEVLSLWGLTT